MRVSQGVPNLRTVRLILFGLVLTCPNLRAVFGVPIYYNHPTIFRDEAGGRVIVHEGSIERMNPDGTHITVVGGLTNPSGITFDEQDNLYISDYIGGAVNLYKWEQDTDVLTLLGQGWSRSANKISLAGWGADIAIPEPVSILLLCVGGLTLFRRR